MMQLKIKLTQRSHITYFWTIDMTVQNDSLTVTKTHIPTTIRHEKRADT